MCCGDKTSRPMWLLTTPPQPPQHPALQFAKRFSLDTMAGMPSALPESRRRPVLAASHLRPRAPTKTQPDRFSWDLKTQGCYGPVCHEPPLRNMGSSCFLCSKAAELFALIIYIVQPCTTIAPDDVVERFLYDCMTITE